MDNNKVSFEAVGKFKSVCNENVIISNLLKFDANHYLIPPILDCGAGLGDIASRAFEDKEAILLDVNPILKNAGNTSKFHKIVVDDFFEFYPEKKINTLLISHTLQFIDSDVKRLNQHIALIDPVSIILVLNKNDDLLGELIAWTKEHYKNPNPEEKIDGFPKGYILEQSLPFEAQVVCSSFELLALQISYLMMIDLSKTGDKLVTFLKDKLIKPEFSIRQAIEIYKKTDLS